MRLGCNRLAPSVETTSQKTIRPGASLFKRILPVIALLSLPVLAGTVDVQVTDATGKAARRASITLRASGADSRDVTSDSTGRARFENVSAGTYELAGWASDGASVSQMITVSEEATLIHLKLAPPFRDDITVRATQVAVDAERIPGSVEVIGTDLLSSSRVFTFNEALRKATGLNVRDEEGFGLRPNIGIRGLNPTRSSKVLLLEDGMPFTYAPYGDNASYYHPPVERFTAIEILKGSGQIAYGPSTVAGVINYITPDPPARQTTTVSVAGGNRDYLNAVLTYGGTWGRTGVLIDVMRKQGDGSRENVHSDLNDVNAKVVLDLSSTQKLTLRSNYYSEDSQVTYSGLRQSEYDLNPRQNPFKNDEFEGDRFGTSAVHALRINDRMTLSTNLYAAQFSRNWWRQSSNSAQRPNDSADPACGGILNLNTTCGNEGRLREYVTFGVEPRFHLIGNVAGFASETDLGIRAHFEDQDRLQVNGSTPTARRGSVVERNERQNRAYSAFVQNRFSRGPWSVTPGVRIEQITFERTNKLANSGAGVTGKTDLTEIIPGLGVSYNRGGTTVFAGLHRGFAPPRTEDLINNTTGGVIELDPEESWNSEIGIRTDFRTGIHLDATIFRMDYANQIVPASVAGGVGASLTNGGETLHQGLEIGARFDTTPLLGTSTNAWLRLAYTYIPDSEYAGQRLSAVSGFTSENITGNRLPYSPENLFNGSVGVMFSRGAEAMLEAVFVDEQFGDDLNSVVPSADGQRGLIPSYTTWNATVNFDVKSLDSTFFVTVKNLLDDTYIVDRARGILPGSPRLVQAGFTFKR